MPGLAITGLARNGDLFDLFAVKIADRSFDERTLFVDECRRAGCESCLSHGFPHPQQVFEVAFDLRFGARSARSAENNTHALRNIKFFCDCLQSAAVLGISNFARNAAATGSIRHQNRVAPS